MSGTEYIMELQVNIFVLEDISNLPRLLNQSCDCLWWKAPLLHAMLIPTAISHVGVRSRKHFLIHFARCPINFSQDFRETSILYFVGGDYFCFWKQILIYISIFWPVCSKRDEANPGLVETLIVIYLPLEEDVSQD